MCIYYSYCVNVTQKLRKACLISNQKVVSIVPKEMLSKNFLYFFVVNIINIVIDVEGVYDCAVSINKGFLDEWSACSKSCGEGTKTKLNCEEGKNCVTLCNLKPCPCKLIKFFHDNVKKMISSCIKFKSFLKRRQMRQNFTKVPLLCKAIVYIFSSN